VSFWKNCILKITDIPVVAWHYNQWDCVGNFCSPVIL